MARPGVRFDPTDPAFLQDPYPTYARLRREAPIAWHEPWQAWIVTRHRDVDALLRDRRLGCGTDPRLSPGPPRYQPRNVFRYLAEFPVGA